MKKLLILPMLAILISGCKTPLNNARAEFLCKDHGGMYNYGNTDAGNKTIVTCNDGKVVRMTSKYFLTVNDPWIAENLKKEN